MSKDPAVLLYTADFMSGVVGLTMQERGQYISLLCQQHQQGHLSEKTICLLLGITSVSEIPDVMEKFKIDEDGKYYNERMELETEKRHNFVESRKENAKLGGRPRKDKQKPSAYHMENHTDKRMGNENVNAIEDDSIPVSSNTELRVDGAESNIPNDSYLEQGEQHVNPILDKTEKEVREEQKQMRKKKSGLDERDPVVESLIDETIAYLNAHAGKHYLAKAEPNREFVRARVKDGYGFDDFRFVIENQWLEWRGTTSEKYMRPETLFNPTKFQSYINAPDYSKQAVPKFQNKAGRFEQIDFDKIEV